MVFYILDSNIFPRCLHTSLTQNLDQDWRRKQGLTENPNAYGPLTDGPDYTFRDGRPTPLGSKQLVRMKQQREYAARIIELVGEVDYAIENHSKLQKEKEQKKQDILSSKLKPKGNSCID